MARSDFLFTGTDWYSVDQNQRHVMAKEIEQVDADRLLNTSVEDLAKYFSEKFRIDVPALDVENLVVDQREKQIDVSRDPNRYFSGGGGPFYVTGTEIAVEIPFTGEARAFTFRPTTYTLGANPASVRGSKVHLNIEGTNLDADTVRNHINTTVSQIEDALHVLRSNAGDMNSMLLGEARSLIEARRDKLLASRNMVASLGFKMKERENAQKTYVAPEVRRNIAPIMPVASAAPYKPEPTLATDDYEHILGVMQGMTEVMERSPSAFHSVDEETLRHHFLVQLNGHYQGQATGETFNFEGKTDILIRSEGKNIFIGECKFWGGAKMLTETIDQLLGYSTWRDTKTAVVVFNRNKDFSKVLATIPEVTRQHPQYKRDLPGSTETVFRFMFANKDDRNRELYLTVMAFDVPTLR